MGVGFYQVGRRRGGRSPLTRDHASIRIADLKRTASRTLHRTSVKSISLTLREPNVVVVLEMRAAGDRRSERVALLETPCHYGGVRRWFACPKCARRCAVLYIVRSRLVCRTCGQLAYVTQCMSANDRAEYRRNKILQQLGSNRSSGAQVLRPRGMWRATFKRLQAELEAAPVPELDAKGGVFGSRSDLGSDFAVQQSPNGRSITFVNTRRPPGR